MKVKIVLGLAVIGAAITAAPFFRPPTMEAVITPVLPADALQEVMKGIYAADERIIPPTYEMGAMIVPHHLTASESIASGIKMLTVQKPSTIVLLSPDHFYQCPTVLCTTDHNFRTLRGDVPVEKTAAQAFITNEPDLFLKEHGIGAVLPFIAHYLPGTKVLPLVLSQKQWRASEAELLTLFQSLYDAGAVFVVSSDFSHYLSLNEADEKDEATAKALFASDLEAIAAFDNPSQSDCPQCLYLLATLAKRNGFYNPSVVLHTNSARILHEENVPTTTSHLSMAWYKNAKLSIDDVAFGGDVTVTRNTRTPKIAKDLEEFWSGPGVRVLNLEGPLKEECVPHENPFIFCNKLSLWQGLSGLATHWGMVNNHMFDQSEAGILITSDLIRKADEGALEYMFEESNFRIFPLTVVMNPIEGLPLAFTERQYNDTIENIKKSADEKMDVVFLHYGKEYTALVSENDRTLLRSFIDAGADAVIGMHSHIQSDMEIYNGKPIFYGIGNFIFDQKDTIPTSTAKAVRLREGSGSVLFETKLAIQ